MKNYNLILDNRYFDFEFMWTLLEIRQQQPEVFHEGLGSLSFYFMFPYSIWSLSKNIENFCPYENIIADTNRLENLDSELYLDFENMSIKEKHFNDRYSNIVLEVTKNKHVNAVVFSNDLAEYLNSNYPNVNLIQSPIKNRIDIEPPFSMNIIDYSLYNHNKDEINSKFSTILSVNSFCYNTYMCADYQSYNVLNYEMKKPSNCNNCVETFHDMKRNKLFVPNEEINKICNDGIQNFFVKTNCNNKYERLETYLYYTIKPQHINRVRLKCLKDN